MRRKLGDENRCALFSHVLAEALDEDEDCDRLLILQAAVKCHIAEVPVDADGGRPIRVEGCDPLGHGLLKCGALNSESVEDASDIANGRVLTQLDRFHLQVDFLR